MTFELAGIIEGFYGPPWTHADRLDMIRFLGRFELNLYVYGPKDDPFHRKRWREPYPEEHLTAFDELISVANDNAVELAYAIGPGVSIRYSNQEDRRQLCDKVEAQLKRGFHHIALFLDDVPSTLRDEEDLARYSDLAEAHADLTNCMWEVAQRHQSRLFLCPTVYTDARPDHAYLRRLGALTNEAVPFMWTGVDVVVDQITADQARHWQEMAGRPLLIWDNYPVNDFARWRPFLGPWSGRDPDLSTVATGILSNPMNEAHASMIPLGTLASFVQSPHTYEPDTAWQQTVTKLYGPEADGALSALRAVFGTYPWEPHPLDPLFVPGGPVDIEAVSSVLTRAETSLQSLDIPPVVDSLRPVRTELSTFVESAQRRFAAARNDPAYLESDGMLIYDRGRDHHIIGSGTGDALVPPRGWISREDTPAPVWNVSIGDDRFQMSIDLPRAPGHGEPGLDSAEAPHVAWVLPAANSSEATTLAEEALVILVPAPVGPQPLPPLVRALRMSPFVAKAFSATESLLWSRFLLTTFGGEPSPATASIAEGLKVRSQWRTDGWRVELTLPTAGRRHWRLAATLLELVDGKLVHWSASHRNFAANPSTYVELHT